jgi:hypothetical protein
LLGGCCAQLLSYDEDKMRSLLTDSSSCVVVGLLLRILSSPAVPVQGGTELADRLSRHILQVPEDEGDHHTNSADSEQEQEQEQEQRAKDAEAAKSTVFYQMAGDRAASYVLEAVLECCDARLLRTLLTSSVAGSSEEYVRDDSGNFVFQTILKRVAAVLGNSNSNSNSTTSAADAESMRALARGFVTELLASQELFQMLLLKRGGVIYWLCECVYSYEQALKSSGGKKDKESIGYKVAKYVCDSWVRIDEQAQHRTGVKLTECFASRLASTASSAPGASSSNSSSQSQGQGQGQSQGPNRDSAQLLHARIVGALMKLSSTFSKDQQCSAFAHAIMQSVVCLPADVLVSLASTGLTSRNIFDVLFAHPQYSKYVGQLIKSLSANDGLVSIACHHCGQHIFKQLFACADVADKEVMVQQLAAAAGSAGFAHGSGGASGGQSVLTRSKEGRNSMQLVHFELYVRQPQEWRMQAKKHAQAKSLLDELEFGGASSEAGMASKEASSGKRGREVESSVSSTKSKAAASSSKPAESVAKEEEEGDDDDAAAENADAKSGRKRKRRRKAAGANTGSAESGAAGGGAGAGDDEDDAAEEPVIKETKAAPQMPAPTAAAQPRPSAVPKVAASSASSAASASVSPLHKPHEPSRHAGQGSERRQASEPGSHQQGKEGFKKWEPRGNSGSSSWNHDKPQGFHRHGAGSDNKRAYHERQPYDPQNANRNPNRTDHTKIAMLRSGKLLSSNFLKDEIASLEKEQKKRSRSDEK